ncbi:ABC transporter ATP-binding protein [Sedimentibacter sp. zth1]|uniref:ATP-binding cassette domain-containing protein n=1 Tax=Sedimentibacter sp. zth1 TaxID=2816908 RepID=UPI001A925BCC|nr:ABC transporter ATP-binding protein [Sedimentibacter sp. zth1]QSX05676.1 ABC transporter ATP-binding protein [Sedimentibacter sp. zth1]
MQNTKSCIKIFCKKSSKNLILGIIINIIGLFFTITQATILKKIISMATDGNPNDIIFDSCILISIVLVCRIIIYFLDIKKKQLIECNKQECRNLTVEKFLMQPLKNLYTFKQSDSKEKLDDDFRNVYAKLNNHLPNMISGILAILVYAILIARLNVSLVLIMIIIAVTQVIPPLFSKYFAAKFYIEDREAEAELSECVIAAYKGNATIKLYNLYEWFKKKISTANKKSEMVGRRSTTAFQADKAVQKLINNILNIVTYMVVGFYILHKHISIDEGVYVIALATSFYIEFNKVFNLIPEFSVLKKAAQRIDEWFLTEPNSVDMASFNKVNVINVSKNYGEKQVFKDVSFNLSSDKISFICGENGCGKSTLLKMMVGLINCSKGKISYDGFDPCFVSEQSLLKHINYLKQSDPVLTITSYEMFKMIDEVRIDNTMEIARKFGLNDDEIKNQMITELSGGQKKKVYLSIVLSNDDKFLLLDEPTNSLDKDGIEVLKELLKKRKKGAIIVTHDDDMMNLADKVVSMD